MEPARLSPQARRDAKDTTRWIMADDPIAARAFRATIHKATILLAEYPLVGRERLDLADPPVRFLSLTEFPYVLVYDSATAPPLILRILHGARDLPELLTDFD